MNFFNRLTSVGKMCVIALVVLILTLGIYFSGVLNNLNMPALGSVGKGGYDATIVVNTYSGFSSIVQGNGGLEGSDESDFYKNFGIKLKIIVMDDFDACRASLKNGEVDMAYCTLDALPVEMSGDGTMTDMRYFMPLNFSAGADALVVNGSIKTVSDLKGKTVAFAEGTASHTLLLNTLETSGLTQNDIKAVKVGSGLEAAQAFKAKQVDAALVWSPDDADCVAAISGAKVLSSTAQANSLVSDGLIAKKEYLENNHDKVKKIVEAILWANSEVKFNKDYFDPTAKTFASAFEVDYDFAKATIPAINFATLQDAVNWMGLNSTYSGMTGERIYTKMSRTYTNLGLCKSVLPWSKVAYTEIIEELMTQNNLTNKQDASGTKAKEFTAPTEKMETTTAISDKKVVINFATNSATLDNDARTIVDREIVDMVQQFTNCRMRVEGNTDATGDANYNVELSRKRAQSVVDYLVKEYNISPNRFVVVGNGSKKAIADGVSGASDAYRTTDFMLLAE